jgi:predicted N-acetyltransferase YhbS
MADLALAEGPILGTILDGTYDIWCEGLTPLAYARYWSAQLAIPWGRQNLRRFALVDDGEVLASAKQYDFSATLDGQPVRALGLGAVFTQPAARRRGAARELIERLLERGQREGADLALLFSEIGPDYYARLGFETIQHSLSTLEVAAPERRGAPAQMARFGDDRDIADIVAINAIRAEPFRFHLDRDRDLVHYAITKKRLLAGLTSAKASTPRSVQFFIAEEGASAAAYVVITTDSRGWMLEECGDRDPSGARVGAILQTLLARDPAEERPAITSWLPPGFLPPQVTIASTRPSADVMMVRALSARAKAALPLSADDVLYWHSDAF